MPTACRNSDIIVAIHEGMSATTSATTAACCRSLFVSPTRCARNNTSSTTRHFTCHDASSPVGSFSLHLSCVCGFPLTSQVTSKVMTHKISRRCMSSE
ncbi:hypothetical protein LY76DRAFT_21169 [Colletotrichum caudatum]|nr:hypothetical protein LY76DRAFT_21169 [Colletotrichum caudatum]